MSDRTQEALEALDRLYAELIEIGGAPRPAVLLESDYQAVRAALGSARPPVPPQEISPEMVERFRRALKPCDVACDAHLVQALEAALRVRGEPSRPCPECGDARLIPNALGAGASACPECGLGEPSREPTLEEAIADYGWVYDGRVTFTLNCVSIEEAKRVNALFDALRPDQPLKEVSRMEPFPLVLIPPHEVERETKAFHEKFAKHEDKDGMEPYDWREHQTMQWAIIQGFIGPFTPEGWYTFKRHRALTVSDPDRPGWEAFRSWALEILNGPSAEPDPWPVYDAAAYQAERLRRASE